MFNNIKKYSYILLSRMAAKKTKKELTEEERSKMLERLAQMRDTVAKNRELKKQNATDNKPKNPEVFKAEIDIKKKPILAEETHAKLDNIAVHLEELTTLKKDKIKMKREKEEKEIKEKEVKEVKEIKQAIPLAVVGVGAVPAAEPIKQKEVNLVAPPPTAYAAPTFKLPSSMGSRLWSGGRF